MRRRRFVVIDMNACRDRAIVGPLVERARAEHFRVVFPWVTHYEMSKSRDAVLSTTIATLREFSAAPDAIAFALPSHFHRTREMVFGHTDHEPIDARWTDAYQGLTANIRAGRGDYLNAFRDGADAHAEWTHQMRGLVKDANALRGLTREIVPQLEAADVKAITDGVKNDNRAPLRELLLREFPIPKLERVLRGVGFRPTRARRMANNCSMSALTILAYLRNAIWWAALKGIDTQTDRKLENEGDDIEYALTSMLGIGLVSRDNRARWLAEDLAAVADALWPVTAKYSSSYSVRRE